MSDTPEGFSKKPLNIVLYQPEIPPNTGNTIRLAANTGASLTLVEPLGFDMDDRRLRRAGLDYDEWVNVRICSTLAAALEPFDPQRVFAFSTKATRSFTEVAYQPFDVLMFGPETRGLPDDLRQRFEKTLLRIPMLPHSRSMNMANSVAVALYEAWRQIDYIGALAN